MDKIVISCLLDNHPKLIMQCWNWLASLEAVGAQKRAEIVIHHTPSVTPQDLAFFAALGARLKEVQPFDPGNAHSCCNKIRQLETEALRGADYAILCDTDLLFMECPTHHAVGNAVRANIVDLPNPPFDLCQILVERAGLNSDFRGVPTNLSPGDLTLPTNFNGGLYVLPKATIDTLRTGWPKWARFCLSQSDLLGRWQFHADQLGFALAALEARLATAPLGRPANFPTHVDPAQYPTYYFSTGPEKISAFHYHNRMDASGFLITINVAWVDDQIVAGNDMIAPFRWRTFNDRIFWSFRYATHPELATTVEGFSAAAQLRRQFDAVHSSWSRRITKPLSALATFGRRLWQ